VTCSAFADNGRFIITGCHDGICRLYSVQGAGPLRTVTFSKDSIITCVALHPTGEFAASGSSEGNVFVWRSASGALIPMCQEHTLKRQVILQVAFTRKGSLLALLDRFMLTFTLVPSGHPVLTVKSQDIPYITTRLSEAGLNVTSKGKGGKRFLTHHTGGPGHPSGNPAPAEFQFTAMHCGQVDNRIRSLPEGCVALAGNDREVRCYDFSGFFEEYELLHASLVQESKPTPQTASDQAKKAKRLSSANAKSLDRNDHEAVEDSFVPQAVLEKPLLSFTCRGSPCAMSPGRSGALLVGDVHGNITILRVNHTTGYKEKPPPSELAKIRREKALSSPPKGMS
jgi:WD40 repeat protein